MQRLEVTDPDHEAFVVRLPAQPPRNPMAAEPRATLDLRDTPADDEERLSQRSPG
ncbi:hypothetical protein HLH33_17765 [Gluconacetobacter diazotrophicus]|uniref:Uncharacterized protein n=1 Tax=Gluconacetobacter diazotrophicus TaxID=33996 RepID=A0A7W4I8D0_GLUDI|nr:hypothetical protein [Gluconacetobacter diazotrophicus]MBB2158120.1 hypothetical protein [Gluconacetobacter diazotrophicus]